MSVGLLPRSCYRRQPVNAKHSQSSIENSHATGIQAVLRFPVGSPSPSERRALRKLLFNDSQVRDGWGIKKTKEHLTIVSTLIICIVLHVINAI